MEDAQYMEMHLILGTMVPGDGIAMKPIRLELS